MKLLKSIFLISLLWFASNSYSQSIWSDNVIEFTQGTTNLANPVPLERSNPQMAIGFTDNADQSNFVSLGFAGSLTLKMSSPISNGEGVDLKIWETTYNSPNCESYPEKAFVFASQDACNWYPLGEICQDSELDLGELNWALYIRIIDSSPIEGFKRIGEVDAYDVDAVEGYYLETEMTPTDLQAGCATGVIEYVQGTRKNGTPITLSRTNPLNALGIPQGTDVVNFVSLGFGGYLVVELDFVKFNQVGWDLQITETSYGNPQCQSYPERVFIEVSKDLTNWVYVDILCLDGYVDVQFIDWFKYVRLTDRSAATKFSGSADGYDVDGILTIQDCQTQQSRLVDFDDVTTPDEDFEEVLYPNPFTDEINLKTNEVVEVCIMDFAGRRIKTFTTSGKFKTDDLKSGYYYFEVREKNGMKTIQKLVKR